LETFFPANLLASTEETKPNVTKANIHLEHKNTTTQNRQKLKPGLVTSYGLRPLNGTGHILQLLGPTLSKTGIQWAVGIC